MRNKQKHQDLGSLPEGPLVEILSRVPYSSLCRFKCVSRPWLALCSAPDIRKRSPQTLSGFFDDMGGFCNLSGRGPPMVDPLLPFLDKSYGLVLPEHCCGGLVLCRCWKSPDSDIHGYNLVVCNPATENWIELPPCPMESPKREVVTLLGFDPAVPSRFVVFVVKFAKVAVYSSGRWTTVESGWIDQPLPPIGPSKCVFLNDTMHAMTHKPSVITVDSEGKAWREIDLPGNLRRDYTKSSIGQSQGRLYAWHVGYPTCQLSVWALEDYASAKWTLKHSVDILKLFGRRRRKDDKSYEMFAIHPHRNLIFLTDGKKKAISYDMDNRGVHVIPTSKDLRDAQPYIPCFAEWPSDGH